MFAQQYGNDVKQDEAWRFLYELVWVFSTCTCTTCLTNAKKLLRMRARVQCECLAIVHDRTVVTIVLSMPKTIATFSDLMR